MAAMVSHLKGAFQKVDPSVLHGNIAAGQVIEAGPAKIQVLNQAYAANNDFVNNSSVAYLVSLNGTNVVFLGDMARSGGENLMANVDLGGIKLYHGTDGSPRSERC